MTVELSPDRKPEQRDEEPSPRRSLLSRIIGGLTLNVPPSDPGYNTGTLEIEVEEMDFDSLPIDTSPLPLDQRMPPKQRAAEMEETRLAVKRMLEAKRNTGEPLVGETFRNISYEEAVRSLGDEFVQ